MEGKLVDDPSLDAAAYDRQWMVNVLGTVAVMGGAAQKMTDGGRIVFIGSGLGSRALMAGVADYGGTKPAIVGYARRVQRDLGPRNVVQPGLMPTDMGRKPPNIFPMRYWTCIRSIAKPNSRRSRPR